MANKYYDIEFIGGPIDGHVFKQVNPLCLEHGYEETGPTGQRHLWLLDESEWGYVLTYQGARAACAGR